MREYKFRGIDINGSEFIYGYGVVVCHEINEASIIHKQGHNLTQHTPVAIETIGQYTGLKDKNEVEIYESDAVIDTLTKAIYLVKFGFCKKYAFNGWYLKGINIDMESSITDGKSECFEVIGNIHQNPELL